MIETIELNALATVMGGNDVVDRSSAALRSAVDGINYAGGYARGFIQHKINPPKTGEEALNQCTRAIVSNQTKAWRGEWDAMKCDDVLK